MIPAGPTPSAPEAPRIWGLDLLRAAAILLVLVSHGGLALLLHQTVTALAPSLPILGPWALLTGHFGLLGVEVFFVLSGYLIGGLLWELNGEPGPAAVRRFYVRRFFRTIPLFGLALGLNVLFERLWKGNALDARQVLEAGLFCGNLWRPHLAFFPESWSLAVEEWFYLLFPLGLLAAGLARGPRRSSFWITGGLLYLTAFALRWHSAGLPDGTWIDTQRCSVWLRLDALVTGVLAAGLHRAAPEAWCRWRWPLLLAGLGLAGAAYLSIWTWVGVIPTTIDDTFFARTLRFTALSTGVALLLPFLSTLAAPADNGLLRSIRRIALWSYALYLVHWPLFQLLSGGPLAAWHQKPEHHVLMFLGKQAAALALAALVYRLWEKPFLRLRDRLMP